MAHTPRQFGFSAACRATDRVSADIAEVLATVGRVRLRDREDGLEAEGARSLKRYGLRW